jgi:hypothetical protein
VAGVEKRKMFFMAFFIRKYMPEGYFFIFIKVAALCVIRSENVSLFKEYRNKRHHETDHASPFTGLQGLVTVTET